MSKLTMQDRSDARLSHRHLFSVRHAGRLALIACAFVLIACTSHAAPDEVGGATEPTTTPAAESAAAAGPDSLEDGVALEAEQIAKLGIVTQPAHAIRYSPEEEGYGVVVAHDVIAQSLAALATAEAAVHQSRAVLRRAKKLAGTSGAFAVENLENAERQAASDTTALMLAQRNLTAAFGISAPWGNNMRSPVLTELATGQTKLVRITFPLGTLSGLPKSVRIARLDAIGAGSQDSRAVAGMHNEEDPSVRPSNAEAAGAVSGWITRAVWNAPADATVPGRSFFALFQDSDVEEGERVQVWALSEAAESGAVVPAIATVIGEGRYWCYVEGQPGHFTRRPVDVSRPVADGYFTPDSVKSGEPVVTRGGGLLLAREINPSTEAE